MEMVWNPSTVSCSGLQRVMTSAHVSAAELVQHPVPLRPSREGLTVVGVRVRASSRKPSWA
jgi:hypothetical protein